METTALYVELVIIGVEVLTWIVGLIILFTDLSTLNCLKKLLENGSMLVYILGISYVFGMIFDKMMDILLKRGEKKIRNKYELETKSTITIWVKANQESNFKYNRSKIRILRSSGLNILLITIILFFNGFRYFDNQVLLILFVIFGFIFSFFFILWILENSS